MDHHFNVEIAKDYGIEEAILIDHLFFWILKNEANDKNFFEGRYWTYSSASAMAKLFPYMNKATISRKLNRLADEGFLLKGNFNNSAYDRTIWYAFSDKAVEYLSKRGYGFFKTQNPFCKMRNGISENETPIPYTVTDNLTDNNKEGEHGSPAPQETAELDFGVTYPTSTEVEREKVPQKREREPRGTTESTMCLFSNSRYADFEDFKKCFEGAEFEGVDIAYYYHSVADWSASKGAKKKDWIATARGFMRRDNDAGKLKRITQQQPMTQEDYDGMMRYLKGDY